VCPTLAQVQHDEAGSMGIILNRPTQYTMSQVTEKAGPFGDNPVYFGGDGAWVPASIPRGAALRQASGIARHGCLWPLK
jgi:putative AlgH/UPF0301 family transcriptional regulator